MAAIGRNLRLVCLCALLSLTAFAADQSSNARQQVAAVAEALTSGDADEAMSHFAKSFSDYEKLRRYFDGLAAFQVENELDYTDEEDSDSSVVLTVRWDLTLTDFGSDKSTRRTAEIHVKVAPVNSKWRITEFAPMDIFNPQSQPQSPSQSQSEP